MSPSRPRLTTRTACTSKYPMIIHSRYVMLPAANGCRPMPRKIAGIEMITIEASIIATIMLSVVLDRATQR